MAWVRFDPGFTRHKKRLKSSLAMNWLWVCGVDYAVEHLTDGHLPREALSTLSPLVQGRALRDATDALVTVGAWTSDAEGYLIHHFLDYQPSAADVRQQREAGKQRARDWRSRRNGERTANDEANV